MLRLVSYDVANTRLRTRIARMLLRQGFERLQLSVFAGEIERDAWEQLWHKIKETAGSLPDEGSFIFSIILAPEQFRNLDCIGTPPDVEYIMGNTTVLYL